MGIIQSQSSLKEVSKDVYFRCDPIHVFNLKKHFNLYPSNIKTQYLTNIINYITNGTNLKADLYSLEPTKNIYVSVTEFENGLPSIFNNDGNFKDLITFLKDDVEADYYEQFIRGHINTDEIIVARSGAIGKAAWFGEFIKNNPDLNLIASGFTTKLKIKPKNDERFISLWLNLPFIKHYIVAKSCGKCQRNISQTYLYEIPFPDIIYNSQKKIANKFYPLIKKNEEKISKVPSNGAIVDNALSRALNININLPSSKGIRSSEDCLVNISNRYCFRCDAKQEQSYFKKVLKILNKIKITEFEELFQGEFVKGKQPQYLSDPEEEGVPIISTLAIQDLCLVKEACKKIFYEVYEKIPNELKPMKSDILITLDGAVSVGKPLLYNEEEDYGIDSHIGIVRTKKEKYDPEIVALILGSELCQAQFRMYESGATSHSINEVELRKLKIPLLNKKELRDFKSFYGKENREKNKLLLNSIQERDNLYNLFVNEIQKTI